MRYKQLYLQIANNMATVNKQQISEQTNRIIMHKCHIAHEQRFAFMTGSVCKLFTKIIHNICV